VLGDVYRGGVGRTASWPVLGGLFDPRNETAANLQIQAGWTSTGILNDLPATIPPWQYYRDLAGLGR
jgi:hypothetical protein